MIPSTDQALLKEWEIVCQKQGEVLVKLQNLKWYQVWTMIKVKRELNFLHNRWIALFDFLQKTEHLRSHTKTSEI